MRESTCPTKPRPNLELRGEGMFFGTRPLRRREFIAALFGAAAWPLAGQPQQPERLRRVGVLLLWPENDPMARASVAAFAQALERFGWVEGKNIRIDYRFAAGDPTLYKTYAAELVGLSPDVLLAGASLAIAALRQQTRTIPIVLVNVTDPVGQGFVESLARPGGNITGFTDYDPPMTGKWLGMLTQIIPPVARVAVLFNPATAPFAGLMLRAIEETAPSLAVAARAAPCRDDAEVAAMMAGLAREERGGLLVVPENFNIVHRDAIITLAAQYRLPAVYPYRFFTAAGGLMSYGIDPIDLFRRAASYVD